MKKSVADALAKMTPQEREEFEERAAIMQFDGNLDRQLAEMLALKEKTRKQDTLFENGIPYV